MNVLSLFDGMSCGQIALERLGVKVDNYFASEIDKYAINVAKSNYPNTKHLGNVVDIKGHSLPQIDLLIGGSPCQDLSVAKQGGKGLEGSKSQLFYEYVRIWKETKPKHFLLENVGSMKNEDRDVITEIMGVSPITINSKLVSGLERRRHYWTNIPNITVPSDKGVTLDSIIDLEVDEKYYFTEGTHKSLEKIMHRSEAKGHGFRSGIIDQSELNNPEIKFKNLDANYHKGCDGKRSMVRIRGRNRRITPTEAERLQTVPVGYTAAANTSDTRRYMMLGNGWTIDVITHILKEIK
jgi:DNA (cytosine-5)-methyltransferase 3A